MDSNNKKWPYNKISDKGLQTLSITMPFGKYKGKKCIDILLSKDWGYFCGYLKNEVFMNPENKTDLARAIRLATWLADELSWEEREIRSWGGANWFDD